MLFRSDSTPAIRAHKVYDAALGAWTVLDKALISSITYSELRNLARNTGLTQGSWFKITDKSNALALAITISKVQYVDNNNNFIIDDLAASATYVVNSQNLLIDDVNGVWDSENNKLKFSFSEVGQDSNHFENFLMFGRSGINFIKIKIKNLISSVQGNSIKWNKGIFFDFLKELRGQYDVEGGIVSKTKHDTDKAALQKNIDNVSASNQSILSLAKTYTDGEVTNKNIYGKTFPVPVTGGTSSDIRQGDTLFAIILKFNHWIKKLSFANGISLSRNFSSSKTGKVNNNDTVESAISKLQNQQDNFKFRLPNDFKPLELAHQPLRPNDENSVCFAKIESERRLVIDTETPWYVSSIKTGYGPSGQETNNEIRYRVHNGFLEISVLKPIIFNWLYTRTAIDDRVRFNSFGFSEEFINKIFKFLPITNKCYEYFNVFFLSELGTGVICNIRGVSITTSLKFAYAFYENKYQLGIAYVPLYKTNVDPTTQPSPTGINLKIESGYNQTFQSICGANSPEMYVPPMLIRFKLC